MRCDMPLTFLDLGELHAGDLSECERSKGKFVQVRHQEFGEFIIFAPPSLCTFHAQIMELFCLQQRPAWAFEINEKRDDGALYEENAEIVGGGHFEVYENKKRLNLSGASLAFGDYEPYLLDQKLQNIPRFDGFRIFC